MRSGITSKIAGVATRIPEKAKLLEGFVGFSTNSRTMPSRSSITMPHWCGSATSLTPEQGPLLGDVHLDTVAMISEIALYAVRVRMCVYKNFVNTVPAAQLEPNPKNGYALN